MSDEFLSVENLTKDYKEGKGVFNVSFSIMQGEYCALIGSNGAGKTTLIRLIMNFIHPDNGQIKLKGKIVDKDNSVINKICSYLPGEINFPDLKSGEDFIRLQSNLDSSLNKEEANRLINMFQLDTSGNPKKMSKGMKQKLAIVNAFAKDKESYILDEPTTGLDPLMRKNFSDLLVKEKAKNKTLLMSTNNLDEIDVLFDKLIYLSEGRVLSVINLRQFYSNKIKIFKVIFKEYNNLSRENFNFEILYYDRSLNAYYFLINEEQVNNFIKEISKIEFLDFSEENFSISEYIKYKVSNKYEE